MSVDGSAFILCLKDVAWCQIMQGLATLTETQQRPECTIITERKLMKGFYIKRAAQSLSPQAAAGSMPALTTVLL